MADLQIGRSGEEKRTIKSAAGKTTFEIEIELSEVTEESTSSKDGTHVPPSGKQG